MDSEVGMKKVHYEVFTGRFSHNYKKACLTIERSMKKTKWITSYYKGDITCKKCLAILANEKSK